MKLTKFGSQLTYTKRYKVQNEKDTFIQILNSLEQINNRTLILINDFNINLYEYESAFINIIESLIYSQYGELKGDVIFWYLYERYNVNGELLSINYKDNTYVLDTVEDLWEFINKIEE